MANRVYSVGLLLAFALTGATGCSSKKGFPVSGKVLVNGQPAAGVIVVLTPVENPETWDKKPSGMTKEDGRFVLNTLNESDGVAAGEYMVSITWPGKPKSSAPKGLAGGEDERATASDQLRGKYSDPKASGLKVSIKSESNELSPFDLKN